MTDTVITRAPHAAALVVDDLRKTYEGRGGSVEAIRNLSFQIKAGEFVCVVGPSGAGKTTLLRTLAGLLPASGGTIRLGSDRVTSPPPGLAVVLQEYGRSLFPWMTVRDNVEIPLKEKRVPKSERKVLVEDALQAVSLGDAGDRYPWQLSGGMQQRVAIARAVAYEPDVLLMDEPFAAVDAQTRFELEDLMRSLWKRLGVTVVFVTHDIDEAIYLGERVLVLSGRPTILLDDVAVDLGDERSQAMTRASKPFALLRTRVYELVQAAKKGARSIDEADLS